MRVHHLSVAALLAATFAVPSISQGAAEPQYRYTVTALLPLTPGVPPWGPRLVMPQINNSGMICGPNWGAPVAFCYDAGYAFDLPPLEGDTMTWVDGMNDLGQAVGSSHAGPEDPSYAVIWNKGKVSQLPFNLSNATDINNAGYIVGNDRGGFLLKDGVVHHLPNAPGGLSVSPIGINNKDQIIGESQVPDPTGQYSTAHHAFLHEGGVTRDLGTLGGRNSWPGDINDRGQVVGTSEVSLREYSPRHAFIYDNNVMVDLGAARNGDSTHGNGINNRGQVVGMVENGYSNRGFLWERDTGYQYLDDMIDPAEGWRIVDATSINDRQEIVGYGCNGDGCGPVLLKRCAGADGKSPTERAPQSERPSDRRNPDGERYGPDGAGANGGSVLAVPL